MTIAAAATSEMKVRVDERLKRDMAAPDWTAAFFREDIKRLAALYREHDKPYALGSAYTAYLDRSIGQWLQRGQLYGAYKDGAPIALAVVEVASAPTPITDFSRDIIGWSLSRDICVRRMACAPGCEDMLAIMLALLVEDHPEAWLEIWQENIHERYAAAANDFRWISSKVAASSELIGLWRRGPGSKEVSGIEQAALVPLKLQSFDVEPLRKRIEEYGPSWADHYAPYNQKHTWSALSLRGYGPDPQFIIKPSEMSKKWKSKNPELLSLGLSDTPLRAKLPEAEPIIEAIPGRKHRVRIMRLAPKEGELSRHADITDPDAGVAPGKLLRIHVPIVTNPQVIFTQWLLYGDKRSAHMSLGEAWYLDTRKPHTAINGGETERIHLVIDVESCPDLLALVPQE